MTDRASAPGTEPSPKNLLAAISWTLLVGVMFGGYSLLRMLSSGDGLSEFEEQFFRAGHAHAGVLATIGLLYSSYLDQTALSRRRQILAWSVYLVGTLAMSGGLFLHMMIGKEGEGSAGTTVTAIGGVILAGAVLYLAWHLFAARTPHSSSRLRNPSPNPAGPAD